jgi:hypothetical protein
MVEIKLEGSSLECRNWLKDCLKVFQPVKRMRVEVACSYRELPKSVLARTRGRVTVNRDVDPESLLLRGVSNARSRRQLHRSFSVEVNATVKKIRNEKLREQVVKNLLVHELMHIERKDLLELSKSYHRRLRKRVHAGLDKEAFERYNELRDLEGLPRIASRRDLDIAVSKVFERDG